MNIKFSINKKPVKHNEKGRPWYDTIKGVKKSLKSLGTFQRLLSERRTAGYNRNERLNEFYVLGRYWLDTCGNCCKIQGYVPKVELPKIPDVLTRDKFLVYIKKNSVNGEDTMISSSYESGLPHEGVICPVCKKEWDIGNCHDTMVLHKTEVFPLSDLVGKTLGEVKMTYAKRNDAIYRMQSDILIRNDRFIDLSPEYPKPEHDWQKGVVKNEKGWVSERDGIMDDYVIQENDEGFFNIWTYYHGDCHLKSVADDPVFLGENGHFKNLAGAAYADIVIEKELKEAGIEIIKGDRTRSEVPFTLTGKLGTFLFGRAWTYWIVACMMPLEAAKEMYENKIGAKSVRVAGHCGCPPPEKYACIGKDNQKYIRSYHIDTMPGLKLFAETTRKYGLA